jgi:predicted transcriptional regulator
MHERADAKRVELAVRLVRAYVAGQKLPVRDLPGLIERVHDALAKLSASTEHPRQPAVPSDQSVTPDFLICLEDGKRFRTLRRHLMVSHNLTPQEYRERWGLPANYPMVAPNYSRFRARIAKRAGLGGRTGK